MSKWHQARGADLDTSSRACIIADILKKPRPKSRRSGAPRRWPHEPGYGLCPTLRSRYPFPRTLVHPALSFVAAQDSGSCSPIRLQNGSPARRYPGAFESTPRNELPGVLSKTWLGWSLLGAPGTPSTRMGADSVANQAGSPENPWFSSSIHPLVGSQTPPSINASMSITLT